MKVRPLFSERWGMRAAYRLKQIRDALTAYSIFRDLSARERWERKELEKFQKERLSALVRHATINSPFYREFFGHIRTGKDVVLEYLPVLDKSTVMENFDRLVTDPRLRLSELREHFSGLSLDELYLGEYRVLSTSGSSGQKGVFVFNRREWSTTVAAALRCASYMGVTPRLPYRRRCASIGAGSPMHVSFRYWASADIGLYKILRLSATSGIGDLVGALNAFQPEFLTAYSSIASLLAKEQLEGRLNIRPGVVSTMAEVRTRGMERTIREAWGVEPFDNYGMTELGLAFGCDCPFHRGVHAFEDFFIAEVVDERNRAVPAGTQGYKLLLTNLFNFTQPLIRCEVSDMLTMDPEPCPCGRPFRLVSEIEGRSDDIICLKDREGRDVAVPPALFDDPMEALMDIQEYRIVQEKDGLHLYVAVGDRASREGVERKIRDRLRESIMSSGAICPDICVRFVERVERYPRQMGKLKRIQSDFRNPPVS